VITKQTAALLYAYGYKLVDANGHKYLVECCLENELSIRKVEPLRAPFLTAIEFDQIGKDYFILARPMADLTKEITIDGESFVPIVEIAKLAYPGKTDFEVKTDDGGYLDDGFMTTFFYEDGNFNSSNKSRFANQSALFKKLSEWHFSHDLPAGSWKPLM